MPLDPAAHGATSQFPKSYLCFRTRITATLNDYADSGGGTLVRMEAEIPHQVAPEAAGRDKLTLQMPQFIIDN
jgi:hypothetical protein